MTGKKFETMSPEEKREYYDNKVRWVVNYAYKNAPAIRDRFDRIGLSPSQIMSVKDLEKIPVTTKEKLIELQKKQPPFGGFLAVPREKVMKYFVSTGPIYDVLGTSKQFWDMQKEIFYNVGFRKGDIVLVSFSYHLLPAAWDADEALRRIGASVIPGGAGNSSNQMEIARAVGATGYVGTPSFLINLIKKAEGMGYDFRSDFKLKKAAVGGEPLTDSVRSELEEKYGISVFNIFGTADIQWVGYECEYKTGMHISEGVLMEIVDPQTGRKVEPGETGEIVVTTFDETYPLIRFGLGDLAVMNDEPCPCGRTLPRLVKFAGRVRDVVRVRGRFIYPSSVDSAVRKFKEISKYQLVVSRPSHRDELTLTIELVRKGIDDIDKIGLEDSLKESFKEFCALSLDKVRFVPPGTIEGEKKVVDERYWD